MSAKVDPPAEGPGGYEPADVRPVVTTGSAGNMGLWAFCAVLAAGGGVLFSALNASRETAQASTVLQPRTGDSVRIASPPPLEIPVTFANDPRGTLRLLPPVAPLRGLGMAQPPAAPRYRPQEPVPPYMAYPPRPPEPMGPQPYQQQPPRAVFDNQNNLSGAAPSPGTGDQGARVTADRFLNPSLTIPKGTVIPAVLETALDSTRPGGVRALVQRDVSGFDGSRVLVPRGSRLYGEYEANLEPGQNRALVRWTRLIRPDGVTIALDSPSSDPLGRAGVRGKVDSKFFQRFGSAILQSALDIGVGVAVNRAADGVILALPGSTQNVRVADPQQIQPTLTVKHGTSVSVFVARDLDFSTVDR